MKREKQRMPTAPAESVSRADPAAYFVQFFAPTLLGNIIGGVSLVAFLGHAQVVAGKQAQAQSK
jgi:formate/nitrite transporter FocA (FNT family)